ncbi:hypothetical protein PoMZ_10331 [Pyricularia oryzae]|uniref:Uncharacterized protein n=1 Tax=Pyricularia oryzae TaxID=318829 RepID=A0A4V1C4Z7_PYROR|nr:hypothetical protein PoMZ_10331 [Pyricularia oryzae]
MALKAASHAAARASLCWSRSAIRRTTSGLLLDGGDAHLLGGDLILAVIPSIVTLVAEELVLVVFAGSVGVYPVQIRDHDLPNPRKRSQSLANKVGFEASLAGLLHNDILDRYPLEGLQNGEELRSGAPAVKDTDKTPLEIGLDAGKQLLQLFDLWAVAVLKELLHSSDSVI